MRDLHEDRLGSTDEAGRRINIYPADVRGRWKQLKKIVYPVLVVIFLLAPWIKLDDGSQLLLLNISERRFSIFGLQFWAHDAPMMLFVFGGAAFSLVIVTALFGRVWCGWACPQTVFIDGVFRILERWIEGDNVQRRLLDKAPLSFDKILKRSSKWIVFSGLSLIITHSFLAYFVGSDELLKMIQTSPSDNMTSFLFILVSTGIILFNFGWFREQFCVIMCPYGRFQSILMDDQSFTVMYDQNRGEPRRTKVPDGQAQGDCVNCFRCVDVCPTAIDIRRGTQLECIGCTNCIDACDDIMVKLKKPKGLIRYESAHGLLGKPSRLLRPRIIFYLIIWSAIFLSMIYFVSHRKPLAITWNRTLSSPYVVQSDSTILNQIRLHVYNQTFKPIEIHPITKNTEITIASQEADFFVPPGTKKDFVLMVMFPKKMLQNGKAKTSIQLTELQSAELLLLGPFQ